jgi:hypothetical protein
MTFNARSPFAFTAVICAIAALALARQPAICAEQPVAKTAPAAVEQAKAMIQALGSDSYSTRMQARNALLQLGRAAIEPLEFAAQSDDPEVRLRAAEILIALRGRGFMGLGLVEDETGEDEVSVPPRGGARGGVLANQLVLAQQYERYGVTKPFPAQTAGVQAGDRILAVNDRPVRGIKDLMREVIIIGPARLAVLLIERDGKLMRLSLILTRNPILQKDFMIQSDPPPPVDLEKEAEQQPAPSKQT